MSQLFEVRELTVRYGGLLAVDAVSFEVAEGEIVGLIGPNGAGKTTCIDALTGFATITDGRVRLAGEDVGGLPAHRLAPRGVVRTFQSLELFNDLTARENLLVAAGQPRWWAPFADAFGAKRGEVGVDEAADFALHAMGLTAVAGRTPNELPNGARHLLTIARALASRPQLVLLDEPAAGLDSSETRVLAERLRGLPALGTSVLLVDHDMSLVLGICDTVYVLDAGQVIARGSPSAIRENPDVIAAYLGTSAP